jgi:hypothetical protein
MMEKTEIPFIVRDRTNRALINTDNAGFATFKQNRDRELKVSAICNQVNNLQCEMREIKTLLSNILSKVNNG